MCIFLFYVRTQLLADLDQVCNGMWNHCALRMVKMRQRVTGISSVSDGASIMGHRSVHDVVGKASDK